MSQSLRDRETLKNDARPGIGFKLACMFGALAVATIAHGQVYKCASDDGRTTYSDAPCDARGKPLRLPSDSKRNATDPNMCAQLLDETHRLAAEAERDAQRSGTASSGNAKRRQALTKQYEARCAGITRSSPHSK